MHNGAAISVSSPPPLRGREHTEFAAQDSISPEFALDLDTEVLLKSLGFIGFVWPKWRERPRPLVEPICITTGLDRGFASGRYSTDVPGRHCNHWTFVGFVWPKQPLGSFGQNAHWVRLAKTPVGFVWPKRRPAHRWTVNPSLFGGAESAGSAERRMAEAAWAGEEGLSAVPALSAA